MSKYTFNLAKAMIVSSRLREILNNQFDFVRYNLTYQMDESLIDNGKALNEVNKTKRQLDESLALAKSIVELDEAIRVQQIELNTTFGISQKLAQVNFLNANIKTLNFILSESKNASITSDKLFEEIANLRANRDELIAREQSERAFSIFAKNSNFICGVLDEQQIKAYQEQLEQQQYLKMKLLDEIAEANRNTRMTLEIDDNLARMVGL